MTTAARALITTMTATIQPARLQLPDLHLLSESQHSPVAQSKSYEHDAPTQFVAHFSDTPQQVSPVAQAPSYIRTPFSERDALTQHLAHFLVP